MSSNMVCSCVLSCLFISILMSQHMHDPLPTKTRANTTSNMYRMRNCQATAPTVAL